MLYDFYCIYNSFKDQYLRRGWQKFDDHDSIWVDEFTNQGVFCFQVECVGSVADKVILKFGTNWHSLLGVPLRNRNPVFADAIPTEEFN